jgi:hypothetical protein
VKKRERERERERESILQRGGGGKNSEPLFHGFIR